MGRHVEAGSGAVGQALPARRPEPVAAFLRGAGRGDPPEAHVADVRVPGRGSVGHLRGVLAAWYDMPAGYEFSHTRRDDGKIIGANRVLLLVRGTSQTKMDPLQEGSSMAADCLLSEPPAQVDLVGYCDFNKMLTYRLDTECVLILASAVDCGAPGSASAAGAAGNARPTATIEHVTKLSKDEVAELTRSLAEEWKAVLTPAQDSTEVHATPERHSKDPSSGYWSEERQRKVRRLASEPTP